MSKPINMQIINSNDGMPLFVVIPYQDYLQWFEKIENLVPHEVVALIIQKQFSPIKAWREYLQLTVTEIAKRIGVDEATLIKIENREIKLSKTMQKKVAKVLNITLEQLDI